MLFNEHGYEGTGLFWAILEKLTAQEKPINTEVLKIRLHVKGKVKREKIWDFLEQIGLITSQNGSTSNTNLAAYIEEQLQKNHKNTQKLKKWRDGGNDNQHLNGNVTDTDIEVKLVRNRIKEKKVNKKKGNKSNSIVPIGTLPFASQNGVQTDLKKEYDELVKTFTSSDDVINKAKQFIREKRPNFLRPFAHLWNYVAPKINRPQIQTLSEERQRQFRSRVAEPEFHELFVVGMEKALTSSFLAESKWFTWDWIFKNGNNYIKLKDGNYD